MARASAIVAAWLLLAGCADNPYVIGRVELDAGTPDAGRDAGMRDAGRDAGGDECGGEHALALVCSGFESEDLLSDWDERALMLNATAERSTVRAHGGQGSLHAQSMGMMSAATVRTRFGPVSGGELYLRLYLYVPDALPTRTINFMFVGEALSYDNFEGVDVNLEDGALQVFSRQGDPMRQTGSLTVPRDQWFCLRARIAVADEGALQLFVDDALALDATGLDTLPAGGLGALRVGIDWSSGQDDFFELYIDDVVLDVAPVECL